MLAMVRGRIYFRCIALKELMDLEGITRFIDEHRVPDSEGHS